LKFYARTAPDFLRTANVAQGVGYRENRAYGSSSPVWFACVKTRIWLMAILFSLISRSF
jgi:hypothetical protein